MQMSENHKSLPTIKGNKEDNKPILSIIISATQIDFHPNVTTIHSEWFLLIDSLNTQDNRLQTQN